MRITDARLRRLGVGCGQIPVLAALQDGRALSQVELARLARIEQPSMAQMLSRMERDGMIERTADPADARRQLISITDAATTLVPAARAVMKQGHAEALAGFSEAETEVLGDLLKRVSDNLNRVEARSPAR